MSRARSDTSLPAEPRALFQDVLKGDIGSTAFVFGNERMGLAEEDMVGDRRRCSVGNPRPTPTLGRSAPASGRPAGRLRWAAGAGPGFPREAGPKATKAAEDRARPTRLSRDGPRRSLRQRGRHARRCGGPIAVRHQGLLGRPGTERLGDFDAEAYEWYFGWPDIKPHFQEHVHTTSKVLIPGMGNDPLLLDLVGAGGRRYHRL